MRIVLCDEEHRNARIDPLEFDLVEILRTNWFDMWSEAELRLWEVARSGKSWRAIFFLLSDGCQPYRCSGLMKVRLISWSMFLLKHSYAVPWDQTETCDLQMDSSVAPCKDLQALLRVCRWCKSSLISAVFAQSGSGQERCFVLFWKKCQRVLCQVCGRVVSVRYSTARVMVVSGSMFSGDKVFGIDSESKNPWYSR